MKIQRKKYLFLACLLGIVISFTTLHQSSLAGEQPSANISALEIFRNAYNNRYTWDGNFPGYTAVVKVEQDGKIDNGTVNINSDLTVDVKGIKSDSAREAVDQQLRMIIIHRRRTPFEVAHKNHTYKLLKSDNDGTVEILEQGKSTEARYKVRDKQIIQVNRKLGDTYVTVDLLNLLDMEKSYIATGYDTAFRQIESQKLLGEMKSEDSYEKVGDYYLLNKQITEELPAGQAKKTRIVMEFKDIQLLPTKQS